MKKINLLLSVFIFAVVLFSANTLVAANSYTTPDNDLREHLDTLKSLNSQHYAIIQRAKKINDTYTLFAPEIITENYNTCINSLENADRIYNTIIQEVAQYNVAKDENTANSIILMEKACQAEYDKALQALQNLEVMHKFYTQIEKRQNEWKTEYQQLAVQTLSLKTNVDKIFVRTTTKDYSFGGMTNVETTNIRKRNIYLAYNLFYNTKVQQLQDCPDGDYYVRLKIVKEIDEVLENAKVIGRLEDTRDLEQLLKNVEDVDIVRTIIADYIKNIAPEIINANSY
jgi:hypothetical protein